MKKEEDLVWYGKNEGNYLDIEEPSCLMPSMPHPLTSFSFQKIK